MPAPAVVIAGGGPAGCVCAARLASKGHAVLLLERERHPRFHLGESLLPGSLTVLDAIGVLGEVQKRFLVKRGARFVDGNDERRSMRYRFADAFHATWDHAFQVPRDAFDELLFRHAAACGAEVRQEWTVTRVRFDGARAIGVEAVDDTGRSHVVNADFVVDATGRDALLARANRDTHPIPGLDRTAIYTQVRGAFRDAGEREGDIQIVVLPTGDGADIGWFWLIPFADGRTSVGAVMPRAWVAQHARNGAVGLFEAALVASPVAAAMLSAARPLFEPRATADFSFRVGRLHGSGWVAVGDATGFIDPLFSTGLHLGVSSALSAADAIHTAIDRAGPESAVADPFDDWERRVRRGADLFLGAVQAFYRGSLSPYLFARDQHPFLRRAITTLLAGDVFDENARWASELRSRFPVVDGTSVEP